MTISRESLKGYILEEVLAYLIRNSGYRILADQSQDPDSLARQGNGLVVKGRGAVHQVDVLGELEWIPAFTFPLRLFVEAKFRNKKTGIDVVRNAVGTILDVNQKISVAPKRTLPKQNFQYEYAVFSASGFTSGAMDMALAHQISLVDLSGEEYRELLNSIGQSCDQIMRTARISGNENNLYNDPGEDEAISRSKIVFQIRNHMRRELGTMPSGIFGHGQFAKESIKEALRPAISSAREYGQLFVAMTNGPYMLLLKADNPIKFLNYVETYPQHRVRISWGSRIDNGRTWIITPEEDQAQYKLSFRLPEIFYRWIFETQKGAVQRAFQTKSTYFRTISIYHQYEGRDHLIKLEYDPNTAFTLIEPSVIT